MEIRTKDYFIIILFIAIHNQINNSKYFEIYKNKTSYYNNFEISKANGHIISNITSKFQLLIWLILEALLKYNIASNIIKYEIDENNSVGLEIIHDITKKRAKSDKLILVSPGITDKSFGLFKINIFKFFSKKGFDVCIYWKRGIKDDIKADSFYCFGKQDDYIEILKYLSKDYKEIYCINISAGCYFPVTIFSNKNFIVPKEIKGSFYISLTLEVENTINDFDKRTDGYFKKKLLKIISRFDKYKSINNSNIKNSIDLIGEIGKINNNESTRADYFKNLQFNYNNLKNITIPSIYFLAKDDPVTKYKYMKDYIKYFKESDYNMVIITQKGSHTAYISIDLIKGFKFGLWIFNIILNAINYKKKVVINTLD